MQSSNLRPQSGYPEVMGEIPAGGKKLGEISRHRITKRPCISPHSGEKLASWL